MRFLADENFPASAVAALTKAGHDVSWIRQIAAGASDRIVLELAAKDRRVLLTFDKDFGELARGAKLPAECGVILFRVPMPKAADLGRVLLDLIVAGPNWQGHFSVIEPGRVRVRPLAP